MKRPLKPYHIVAIAIMVVLPMIAFGCGPASSYPAPNNNSFAEEMITRFYSDEELSNLIRGCNSGQYNQLRDLDGKYQIECIRDPREYDEHYMPYVVFMSESGRKAILFFRPLEDAQNRPGEIIYCISPEVFLSKEKMWNLFYDLEDDQANWTEWTALLEKYECGITRGARHHEFVIAVKEGVYGVVLTHEESEAQHIQEIAFFSDDSLMHDPEHVRENGWDPWLILPIDKT